MAKANDRTTASSENTTGYLLSEEAHSQFRDVQETLQLLQLLAQSNSDDPMVAPALWSSCLRLLGAQLESALEQAIWRDAA